MPGRGEPAACTPLAPDQSNAFFAAQRGQVTYSLTAQSDAIAAEFSLDSGVSG
jgi:hypothetical protein